MEKSDAEEKSLMSDFDDVEIDALVPTFNPPVSREAEERGVKRLRKPSEELGDLLSRPLREEEANGGEESRPKKKRRLKKKAAAALERKEPEEEDEEEEEEQKEKARKVETLGSLFADDEIYSDGEGEKKAEEEDDEKKKKKKKVLQFPEDDPTRQNEEESPISVPTGPTVLLENGNLPVVGGSATLEEIRCVYANDPVTSSWTLLEGVTANVDNCLQRMPWGVFTRRAQTSDGREGNKLPWMIVLAPDELMQCIASPFFYSKVDLVRVNPEQVTLEGELSAPIFYAYGLVQKIPIWGGGIWTVHALTNIMIDTLYAHVEYAFRIANTDASISVRGALSRVDSFPISTKNPETNMLPPASVPLTALSARPKRKETLKEIWEKSSGIKAPSSHGMGIVDTSPLIKCQRFFTSKLDYLFADLEKPAHVWREFVVARRLDCRTLCKATHWARSNVFSVKFYMTRIAAALGADSFSGQGGAATVNEREEDAEVRVDLGTIKTVVSESKILDLAAVVPLSVEWFADWYDTYFEASRNDLEKRLRYYAIFAASQIIHEQYDLARRFGPSGPTVVFTKDRRELLYKSGAPFRNPRQPLIDQLTMEGNERAASPELSGADEITVREATQRFMARFTESGAADYRKYELPDPPRPLKIRCPAQGQIVIVDAEFDMCVIKLATLIITTAAEWNQSIPLTSPLRNIPPVVVECASIYSHGQDESLEDFYRSLRAIVCETSSEETPPDHTPKLLLISPSSSGKNCTRALQDAKRAASGGPVIKMLVFDNFHLWTLKELTEVLTSFSTMAREVFSATTHLVITARAHVLSETSGGGSIVWDIFDVVESLARRLRVGDAAVPVGGIPAFERFASRASKGTMSDQIYDLDTREEQWSMNEKRIKAAFASETVNNIASEYRKREEGKPFQVLVLSALLKTQNILKRLWISVDDSMVTGSRACVTFTSYETFARTPSRFKHSYAFILFADAHYTGAGRFTYHHINAAFERISRRVILLAEVGESQQQTLCNFQEIFTKSDDKTDRLNRHIGRCNLLALMFNKLCEKPMTSKLLDIVKK